MIDAQLELQIRDLAANSEGPAFPKYLDAKSLVLKGALIAGHATERGRTAITMYFEDPETGKRYCANTTARIIVNGLSPAIQGAALRFGDDLTKA